MYLLTIYRIVLDLVDVVIHLVLGLLDQHLPVVGFFKVRYIKLGIIYHSIRVRMDVDDRLGFPLQGVGVEFYFTEIYI